VKTMIYEEYVNYLERIEKATTKEEVRAILNEVENDEVITDEEYFELDNEGDKRIFNIENPEEYTEYDRFDDMWHSGEFN
jgi:hypothetical protein